MEIRDIEKLAELAKIEIKEEEKVELLKDLDGILGYVKQIESVDLPAQAGVGDLDIDYTHRNIWREDVPNDFEFSKDSVVSQFPDEKDGFVKVKKIL